MSVDALVRRDRILTAGGLFAVAALAWLYLLREPSATAHAATMEAAMRGGGSMMPEEDASLPD